MVNMLPPERRKIIIEKLQTDKKVIVSRLSSLLDVSDETIRRDLEILCKDGIAIKSYGGAILNENGNDLPFNVRKLHRPAEKKKIADLVAPLIDDGDKIFLDASTTAVFVARSLKIKKRLTVVTNSIEVMLALSDMDDFTVISTGGRLMGEYFALCGARATESLAAFRADKLIFSCKALCINEGVFDGIDDFSIIKQEMIAASRIKILAADISKFGKTAFSKITTMSNIDMVVTDSNPGEGWLDYFAKEKVECLFES